MTKDCQSPASAAAIADLAELFGDRLLSFASALDHYGATEFWIASALPDAVVRPASTEEVAQAMAICHRHGAPVIPFGAGSSMEGQVIASAGIITFWGLAIGMIFVIIFDYIMRMARSRVM